MANKILTLTDYPEFSEAAEKLSKLRLRKSGLDDKIKALTTQMNQIHMESDNQDIDALIDNPGIELSAHKMRNLSAQVADLTAERDTVQTAVNQARVQLDNIKKRLLPKIAGQFKTKHEKIIREYVTLAGKVYAAHQNNIAFMQDVGAATGINPGELLPTFHLRTLGTESDGYSFLGLLINKAKTSGYEVN